MRTVRKAVYVAAVLMLPSMTALAQVTVIPNAGYQPAYPVPGQTTTMYPNGASTTTAYGQTMTSSPYSSYGNNSIQQQLQQQQFQQQQNQNALSPDMQKYAAMLNNQQYGQQPTAAAAAQPQQNVQYHYTPVDPNDPLSGVELPARLFNNIPPHNY